jgi:hypothetical protein
MGTTEIDAALKMKVAVETARIRSGYYDRDLWLSEEYADFFKIRPQTAQKQRMVASGCPFVRIGGRVYYRRADVLAYVASHLKRHTAETQAGETL